MEAWSPQQQGREGSMAAGKAVGKEGSREGKVDFILLLPPRSREGSMVTSISL